MRYANIEIVYDDGIVENHTINDPEKIDNLVGIVLYATPFNINHVREIRVKFVEELFI